MARRRTRPARSEVDLSGWKVARTLLTRPSLLDVLRDNERELAAGTTIARFRLSGRTYVNVRDPEHVEHVFITHQDRYRKSFHYRLLAVLLGEGLLTNEGESWARQRRLVQPLFAKRHLGRFAEHLTTGIGEFVDRLDAVPEGGELNIAREMNELALDLVGRALFGTNLGAESKRTSRAVLFGVRTGIGAARLQLLVPTPDWLVDYGGRFLMRSPVLPPGVARLGRALREIDAVVYDMIERRETDLEADPGDLLGLLLGVRDEHGQPLERKQVRDELVTFMLAGHETTANGLAWLWYLLSRHPEARERLEAEVDELLGGRVPTAADADRLTWTAACFQEALRLYPPAWIIERDAIVDDEIAGVHVPAGATIVVPTYLVHRDARVWPNPEAFDPRRFLPEQARGRPRGAYLPFGAGRRVCVGASFALMEAVLTIAMIVQRHRLDLVAGARVRPEATITLRPQHGVPMTVHRRARHALPSAA